MPHKTGTVAHTCTLSTGEVEAEGLDAPSYPWQHTVLKAILDDLPFWKVSREHCRPGSWWAHGQSYLILLDTALQKKLRPGHSPQHSKGGGRVRRATQLRQGLTWSIFPSLSNPGELCCDCSGELWRRAVFLQHTGLFKQDMFLCSISQLQSIIKKVIAHFHDFSVLFSVVSSIS